MGYNWGRERRRGTDRREGRDAVYAGPERRSRERRRRSREPTSKLAWLLTAAILFVVADWTIWNGYYRHRAYLAINAEAEAVSDAVDQHLSIG